MQVPIGPIARTMAPDSPSTASTRPGATTSSHHTSSSPADRVLTYCLYVSLISCGDTLRVLSTVGQKWSMKPFPASTPSIKSTKSCQVGGQERGNGRTW